MDGEGAPVKRFLDPYILAMFGTVALAALLPARGQGAVAADLAANAGIVFLFFLHGTRISPGAAWDGLRQGRLHLAVLFSTFALFPGLGLLLQPLATRALPPALATGLLFLCILPSTVQSSIAFTSIARGNVAAALCAASASNLLGVILTPLLAGWLLHSQGAHLSLDVLRDIALQLLAPFLAGQVLRKWIGGWITRHKVVLGLADRGSILLIIYVAFSKGVVDRVWTQIRVADLLVLAVFLVVLLGLALTLTALLARRALKLRIEDEIVLQFCGSKKSLASGLPMAKVLFPGPQLALIVLPLMIFHQLQLIVCAVLARRYANRALPPETATRSSAVLS
jgi:sodium/bile acid cotransporter 7